MITIWKFRLDITPIQTVMIPVLHKLLCVQVQNDRPHVWAEVHKESIKVPVTFFILATGDNDVSLVTRRYLGTVQVEPHVWHVYYHRPHDS